jgi:hypothetical protein
MCCPGPPASRRTELELTCESRALEPPAGESRAGASPRTPSIVPGTCKPKPAGRVKDNWLEILPVRTGSPSLHPRPASGGAADFLLASALRDRHQALRPAGAKDARCIRPMSATQSKNCVCPHLVCSWLALPLSREGCPTESWAPYGVTRGQDVSRRPGPLRRTVIDTKPPRISLTASSRSVGVFFPRCGCGRASDTPVALPASPRAPPAFAGAACHRRRPLLARGHGSEDAGERRDHP